MKLFNLLLLILNSLFVVNIVNSCNNVGKGCPGIHKLYYLEAEYSSPVTPMNVYTPKDDIPHHMVPITGTHLYFSVKAANSARIVLSREQWSKNKNPYYEINLGLSNNHYGYGVRKNGRAPVNAIVNGKKYSDDPDKPVNPDNYTSYWVTFDNFTISFYHKGKNNPLVSIYDHDVAIFPIKYVGFYTFSSEGHWIVGDEDRCWNLQFGKNLKVGDHVYNQDCTKLTCEKGKSKKYEWKNYLIKYKCGKSYPRNAPDKCEIRENKYIGKDLLRSYKFPKCCEPNLFCKI